MAGVCRHRQYIQPWNEPVARGEVKVLTLGVYMCVCCCCSQQAARLREAEPALQKAAERAAASASVVDKVGLNAAAEERKAKLRQQEVCAGCCRQREGI